MSSNARILVLGAGSWGTALATHLAEGVAQVRLWGRNAAQMAAMAECGENARYLPGIPLSPKLGYEADLEQGLDWADAVLLVTPSDSFATMLDRMAPALQGKPFAWACKGFENGTGRLLHEVAQARLGTDASLAVVTGPSFAKEVAQGLPTAMTVACTQAREAEQWAGWLHHARMRVYTSPDIIGAELGGAVKNVMAIATGLSDGMQLGHNAQAAIITRGLAEIMRLGLALGALPETLMGLAGLGDLVLTCTANLSRNRRMGLALGKGLSVAQAQEEIGQHVEGVRNAAEVLRLAERAGVEMPISEQVAAVVAGQRTPAEALNALLSREPKSELD